MRWGGLWKGLDDLAQGEESMMGSRDLMGEVLCIFRKINLCPQGEESSCDSLKFEEGGVLAIIETTEKFINVASIERRDR